MAETDKITQDGKKGIISLLNDSMHVEYGMIINFPRILDQIANIDKSQPQEFTKNMEQLSKDSFRHVTVVTKLIEDLGGKPNFAATVIDRMIDIPSMLVQQSTNEKLAMTIYKEARLIAQNNQVKSGRIFGKLFNIKAEERQEISRTKVIQILEGLESDEYSHLKRCEMALQSMNITPELRGKEFTSSES